MCTSVVSYGDVAMCRQTRAPKMHVLLDEDVDVAPIIAILILKPTE